MQRLLPNSGKWIIIYYQFKSTEWRELITMRYPIILWYLGLIVTCTLIIIPLSLIFNFTHTLKLTLDSALFYYPFILFSSFSFSFSYFTLPFFISSLTACATQTSLNSNFNLYGSPADYSKAQACSVTASKKLYYAFNDCYCTDGGKYLHWQYCMRRLLIILMIRLIIIF